MSTRFSALLRLVTLLALACAGFVFAGPAAADGDPASAPYVYLIDPNGPGMIWYGNDYCYASAEIADADGVGYVQFRLSTDDGATFPIVLGGGVDATSIECITPNVDTTTARVMVVASDALGNTASYTSEYPFTIDAPTLSVASVSVAPAQLAGGSSAVARVELTSAAPAAGATVELSSSNPSVASVPGSVTVPEGETLATFGVATTDVAGTTTVTLGASFGGVTEVVTLTVAPKTAVAPRLASFTLNPFSVVAGKVSVGTVTLTEPAPAGGTAVMLSSSHPDVASVDAGVVVQAGQTTARFEVATVYGSAPTTVAITAALAGTTMSAPLTVTSSDAPVRSIAILRADYLLSQGKLRVAARTASGAETLNVYVSSTGELIGTLKDIGGGEYQGKFTWPTHPVEITVVSNAGGTGTVRVRAR